MKDAELSASCTLRVGVARKGSARSDIDPGVFTEECVRAGVANVLGITVSCVPEGYRSDMAA